ncbi:hypothetical protein MPDQ_006860 [Monascus purpureus]|uniref:MICOS complex subunit MIC12 n=1 Tax=Monascus purpureus TaxID=5098 RepID=A0A507QX61_MONPU|nr:hypothetical protein MPDQ_006860 [Monascus purpureus]BDD55077.1 hypothetical protein MAP00_000631 [Monascus purpureus]
MGFFSGFFSGFALTTSIVYISLQIHRSNRIAQRDAIREQVELINWLSSSSGAYDRRFLPKPPRQMAGEQEAGRIRWPSQPSIKDVLKHRWNDEVEALAKKAFESRWEDGRDIALEGWKAAMRLVKRE